MKLGPDDMSPLEFVAIARWLRYSSLWYIIKNAIGIKRMNRAAFDTGIAVFTRAKRRVSMTHLTHPRKPALNRTLDK